MPVYSFVCPVCGAHFDERLSFSANTNEIICPNGHRGARRVFSAPSIIFKGSGFYVTDSRKSSTREAGAD